MSLRPFEIFALLALSVSACNGPAPAVAAEERGRDFIKLDPGNPRLNYVKVEVVVEAEVAPGLELTGRVAFDENHTQRVASPIDGRATRILVELGEAVKAGQSLVELSSAEVASLHAEVEKASQDLEVADKARARSRKLKEDGAISEKELAQAEAEFQKAKAEATRGAAKLRSLSLSATGPELSASLRARIAGTVVERAVLVGQEVRADAASPLLTVTDLGTVWVLADLYEQDLGLVAPGAEVAVKVPAYPAERFRGKVEHVGDVLDPVTHTVKLRCVVPNPGHRLKPEMFAKVEVGSDGRSKAILLPSRAILTDSEHARVLVAGDGNVYRQRTVDVGPEVDGKVRILGGLEPGEKVVTDGAIFLRREMAE